MCQAWTVAELAGMIEDAGSELASLWPAIALHPDTAIGDRPALLVDRAAGRLLLNGRTWEPPSGDHGVLVDGTRSRAYDDAGTWLGVVRWDGAQRGWRPDKMIG
jgi:hypothetical protein